MPTGFKFSWYAILLAAVSVFTACQSEEPFQENIDPELTLAADSSIVELMKRTTAYDGSDDNIVDGASCLGIQFPYTITANGSELNIASVEDLQKIEDLFDAADDGDHRLQVVFPIMITRADYTEVTVNSEKVFRDYVEQCVEDGDDDDIECVDVVYPVNLFTYDKNLQQTGNVTVNHDRELHRFLAGLAETDLISIEFPLTFDQFDGIELTVSNNIQLSAAIERAMEICDEDDDDDYNDDDFTEKSLNSLLAVCPWSVRKLERTDLEAPEQYEDYVLNFTEDGQVISGDGLGPVSEGSWSVTVSDFKVFLTLQFEDASDFNGTFYTYKIGEATIKMNGSEFGEIILEQQCKNQQKS